MKSTRKITSAMKMVAASKLRRAQVQAEQNRPYAERMAAMLQRVVSSIDINDSSPFLIAGTGKTDVHLVVVVTANRGLCGGFNGSIIRLARQTIRDLIDKDKTVKILCVGKKGRDALRRDHADKIIHTFEDLGRKRLSFGDAQTVVDHILMMAEQKSFDVCTILYNQFKSVIAQTPTAHQLIPFAVHAEETKLNGMKAVYEFEPGEEEILADLLPRNLSIQIFRSLLDSAAGEQAARMTAMENATKNAGDMINRLTLRYNRARQAYITKELIEIISGAEAV